MARKCDRPLRHDGMPGPNVKAFDHAEEGNDDEQFARHHHRGVGLDDARPKGTSPPRARCRGRAEDTPKKTPSFLQMMAIVAMAGMIGTAAATPPPVMSLLDGAKCGQTEKGINETGSFLLAVKVASARRGAFYNCSTYLANVNATPARECIAWLDATPIANDTLRISLRADDSQGRVAACMEWELGSASPAAAWEPSHVGGIAEWVQEAHAALVALDGDVDDSLQHLPINGSGGHFTGRKKAFDQYLDSMTHESYQCVPAGMPQYWPIWNWLPLAIKGRQWGFPPTARTVVQMRLSHTLLAFSGVVWSIDRSCVDDVNYDCIGKNSTVYESCIRHIPGLPDPHCHLLCNQTWALAPGGVAQPWGMHTLSHHIPSPGLSALQDSKGGGGKYGNTGCGAPP